MSSPAPPFDAHACECFSNLFVERPMIIHLKTGRMHMSDYPDYEAKNKNSWDGWDFVVSPMAHHFALVYFCKRYVNALVTAYPVEKKWFNPKSDHQMSSVVYQVRRVIRIEFDLVEKNK